MDPVLHLLLIDDSAADLLLAQEAFDFLDLPVSVRTFAGGQAALDALRRPGAALPDVVLLDVNMPGLDGFAVLSAFKQDPRLVHIPVVMLSTSQGQADVDRAYTLHASAYLAKVADFAGFLAQLQSFVAFWARNRFVRPSGALPE